MSSLIGSAHTQNDPCIATSTIDEEFTRFFQLQRDTIIPTRRYHSFPLFTQMLYLDFESNNSAFSQLQDHSSGTIR